MLKELSLTNFQKKEIYRFKDLTSKVLDCYASLNEEHVR